MMPKVQINVQGDWKPLFTVKFKHDYYPDSVCKDLRLVPTAATLTLLKNYRLLFKPNPQGCTILYETNRTEFILQDLYKIGGKLVFLVFNDNPWLVNVSNLPFRTGGKVYLFSNLNDTSNAKKEKFLHKKALVSVDDACVNLVSRNFEFPLETGVKATDHKLYDAFDKEITDAITPFDNKLNISLSNYPLGFFTLKSKKESVGFYTSDSSFDKCFGVAEFHIGANVPKGCGYFDDKGKAVSQEYIVHIETRSTYWRYIIVDSKNLGYNYFEIDATDKAPAFNPAEKGTLMSGGPATFIIGKTALNLKKLPEHKFFLRLGKNGKVGSQKISLSTPGPETVKPDRANPDRCFSDVYVYL